ncbi:DUF4347 domain-containing protein, partial [Oceanibaculum nanhaiense]|uniref:DUF4347 domain-containing protein n=1 Tax=Oceanibaculum nanhaiense TaxID=1909734 RepID=UPI00111DAE2D
MIANTDKTVLGTPLSSGEAAGGATSGALVVVDTSVQDYQTLLEGLPSGAEILLIDGAGNGFTQLADMLAGRAGVEAIHILSHGNAGMVKLGTDILSLDTLDAHAEALAALSAALAPGGDLLLYGCNTGAGSDGQAFIDRLAELTGADVAASDDLTGAAALGGDWELERNTGDMTASSLMPGDYAHTLETITILDGSEDGTLNDPDGTFVKTVDGKNITFTAGSSDSGGDTPAFFNNAGYMIGYDDIINETKTTISLEAGHSFDLTAFDYYTDYDDTITLDITLADDSTVSGTLAATTGSAQTISDFTVFSGLSSTSLNDIKSVMISTTNSGSNAGFGINNFVVSDVKAIVSNTQPALGGTPDDATINEDTATAIDLSAYNVSDAEDDTITLTLAVDAGTIAATDGNGTTAGVTISSSGSGSMTLQGSAANLNTYLNDTSKIVYTPASNATASATLTITPNDGTIDGTADTVTINITAVNDAPTVTSGEGSGFAENGTGPAYTVTATDPENDTLTFAISGGADAALFDIDASTGAVTFKTPPDYENPADSGGDNSYYIEVTASDGKATSPAKLVAIPVTDVTVATPVFTSGTTAIFAENGTDTVYTATASVSEGVGTPTFSITGGADQALFDIDGSTGAVTFKSAPDFESAKDAGSNNVYDVTVTATVGAQTVDQAITITVTNVNEAPEVTNKTTTATVAENGTGTVYTVTGSDPDAGDTPTFTISGGADANLFSIDKSTGAVTFKTAPDFENPSDNGKNNVYDIEVTASDGTLTSSSKAVAITVTDANDAPTLATNKGASVQTSQTVTITTAMLNEGDQDDDGADLTYALLYGDPTGGDLLLAGVTLAEGDSFTQQDIDDGKLTFKAGSGAGSFGFDFYLRDNDNASLANQEFTITVTTPAPETPTPTTPPVVVTPTTPTTPGSGENTQAET